jgi:Tfp pilus assembly protein FimT
MTPVHGGPKNGGSAARVTGEAGTSLVELVLALAVAATMLALAVPVTASSLDAARAGNAAAFMAVRFRSAHQHAIASSRTTALVFEQVASRWVFRTCEDGNGNGIRRSDITAGRDVCIDGPHDLGQLFPGVAIAVDASLPGPDDEPGAADAVRFGRSDIASFTAIGTATAGTMFVRSTGGRQWAVRVSNVTGRTRLLRYDPGRRLWVNG